MSSHSIFVFFVLLVINIHAFVASDGLNVTALDSSGKLTQVSVLVNSPSVFKPIVDSVYPLSLLSSFPEDVEISEYCNDLLLVLGQRYVAYMSCLIPAARPVKVCQKCYSGYSSLVQIYQNISSDQMGPGNVSCRDSLLHSDRLMLVYLLYSNVENIWDNSNCAQCLSKDFQSQTNDTLFFLNVLNQTLSCFEKYKQMNMTRRLWSKNFNCFLPREETVPVIAVFSFMLFLPIVFYLSSFLHSEQKKRKLIHPNRAKSYTGLMNIQDKQS
nr:osteopetrosis-associated transmembrane protein 1 isoform X2 [Nothobranchius furzeri]